MSDFKCEPLIALTLIRFTDQTPAYAIHPPPSSHVKLDFS